MSKKYVVVPGELRSKHDYDRHFIGAARLMQLYGVSPAECVVAGRFMRGEDVAGLIPLHPSYLGNYSLPGINR